MFDIGRRYSRDEICELLGVAEDRRGGDWDTGYHEHEGQFFVFANVGTTARTGHDHNNRWEGDQLLWHGKRGSRLSQPQMRRMLGGGLPVHIFWRANDRARFEYAGVGRVVRKTDATPAADSVTVLWAFDVGVQLPAAHAAEELPRTVYVEGAAKTINVNAYERNPAARAACIAHFGHTCAVCGFDFGRVFGELGEGFIHVHHLKALSAIDAEYEVDPIRDLRPVCPNCHSMIHRRAESMTIEALRELIEQQRSES